MNAAKMLRLAQERNLTVMLGTASADVGPVDVITVEEDLCTLQIAGSRRMKALMLDEIERVQINGPSLMELFQ